MKVVSAQGLAECKKMMQLAAAGKYNGYLLEGMAWPPAAALPVPALWLILPAAQ